MDLINCRRRNCRKVIVGGKVEIGGNAPIAVQSMTNTTTTDIPASVAQIRRIADAGAALVRLTAQGVREAEAMAQMYPQVNVPLVADIHFNPAAALAAAESVDKVRINPGNFCRPGKNIEEALLPLLDVCKRRGVALRIGVNHGSLSPAIMDEYGDTPEGMVESAMQFLRICAKHDFHQVVISIKASNTVVMVLTVRLLVATMAKEGLEYPLHLGVTEAGDGEDGRIKSAVGIGALLYQGIGDTIRVSLSEDPEREVPVARALLGHIAKAANAPQIDFEYAPGYNPLAPERLGSFRSPYPLVWGLDEIPANAIILTSDHANRVGHIQAQRHALLRQGNDAPVIVRLGYDPADPDLALKAAADFGTLLLNGLQDGIWIDVPGIDTTALALNILQAARLRISKTEFISCPSCGRTMFDLQTTLKAVKAATGHLKGLKIGVMGCIVNGPGEMADADYGYVGAGVGRISLYRRKECVERNIPQEEAISHLVNLIKANGEWVEPTK
ncbi:MAG: (E)-4-hydroxy-3-methylbut-2-enyl-diphosphate synthase [Bacteroides sp.]|nr:(E)-4-hydroxy-3-methylbut-2-enyl-diphosphate synthase [Bacteroides sp.]MCM1379255.1 (E)-4-hydroxy-3-methylbut-2-enyl-diphosphate synthase [Bacteroides sp.]MCM1445087.1 (E)-4-hydroxy-3-methylbut-2-enyl-diphosphate synthase [Prevotella sp.]